MARARRARFCNVVRNDSQELAHISNHRLSSSNWYCKFISSNSICFIRPFWRSNSRQIPKKKNINDNSILVIIYLYRYVDINCYRNNRVMAHLWHSFLPGIRNGNQSTFKNIIYPSNGRKRTYVKCDVFKFDGYGSYKINRTCCCRLHYSNIK